MSEAERAMRDMEKALGRAKDRIRSYRTAAKEGRGKYAAARVTVTLRDLGQKLGELNAGLSDMMRENDNAQISYARRLEPDEALEVYEAAHTSGASQREIAERYGISQNTVSLIKRGESWAEVTGHA